MIKIIFIKDHPYGEWAAVLDIPNTPERYILTHWTEKSIVNFTWWVESWLKAAEKLKLPFDYEAAKEKLASDF